MADQKAMKKALKALMQRPENQVCSDCPEKRPTWASIIAPPPGAPPVSEKIGAFICLECSGSHRRLGVHIAFVRSVNLDSWKDWEVRAMQNGGNTKVNAIYEARLAESGRKQPSHLADGPTRERFIRDKYERRKFYDPSGYSISPSQLASSRSDQGTGSLGTSRPGAPSDIARQRVASRQARMKTTATPSRSKPAKAPVPVPADFDLLDFGAGTTDANPVSAVPTTTSNVFNDTFASTHVTSNQPNLFKSNEPSTQTTAPNASMGNSASSSTTAKPKSTNDDIMALFAPKAQQQFGMQAMNNVMPAGGGGNNNMMMMNGMFAQQSDMTQLQGSNMAFSHQMNPMQQHQQMMMIQQSNDMMGNVNQHQMMMNPMMMQQTMQQQHMQSYGQMANLASLNVYNGDQNSMVGTVTQDMQNMTIVNATKQSNKDDGGFGESIGGGSQQQNMKKDAFSSLNAFR